MYSYYEIANRHLIDTSKYFNQMRNKVAFSKISYQEFSTYYLKYLGVIEENIVGFDYLGYGYALLKAKVKTTGKVEEAKVEDFKNELNSLLAEYIIKQELNKKFIPTKIITNVKRK